MDSNSFFERYDIQLKTQGIPAAEKYALEVLEEANQMADKTLFISIANELGGLYRVTGRFEAGKVVYDAALKTLEEIGMKDSVPYATTLINLASVCSEGKQYQEAINHYLLAEAIYKSSTGVSTYERAALFNNISSALAAEESFSLALEYAQKALELIKKEPKAFTALAISHTTLGSLYLQMENHKKSENHLLEAQRIFTQREDKVPDIHYSQTLNALGELYFVQEKYDKAKESYQSALSMVKKSYGEKSPAATSIAEKLKKFENKAKDEADLLDLFSQAFKKSQGKIEESSYGLSLAESYYETHGKPMLQQKFPEYLQYMAIGLVGEGSECLGFDDEFSRDHDFGPSFCIWLPKAIYQKIGKQLQEAYETLPTEFMDQLRKNTPEGKNRRGVFSIENFYAQYLGKLPKSNIDWLGIPSSHLLTAVNGKIFEDNYGEFTRIREELLHFYPEDVRLKKLAACTFKLSQAGQYNYGRCLKRKDKGGAYMACSEFVRECLSAIYLLNHSYMPYYKWSFRGLNQLSRLSEVKDILQSLIERVDFEQAGEEKIVEIDRICSLIRQELVHQQLSERSDDFLVNHSLIIMEKIKDPQLKQLPVMVDFEK